jgi:hypothetical protein
MSFIIDMPLRKYVFLYLIVIFQLCNIFAEENNGETYYNAEFFLKCEFYGEKTS